MGDIWFTSDPHYYHANIIRYCSRPYESVEEMNEALILNWNRLVRPEDEVYVLGDFSLAFRPVEVIAPRLMGKKKLVPGNHDFCHPSHKKSRNKDNLENWIKKYQVEFEVLPIFSTMTIPGVKEVVNLCHIPYDNPDPYDNRRYDDFRLKDDGRWLLCGHVHEKWKFKDKMINVGVDVWDYKPVHLDEIKQYIQK